MKQITSPRRQQSPSLSLTKKTTAWLNIVLQLLFPMTVAFTPTMVAASTETPQPSEQEQQVANIASQLGQIAASGDAKQSTLDTARNLATQNANNAVSNWLNQFGTARVQLNTNNKFSLEGSQLDMLLPIIDSKQTLTFSQFGIRRLDSRTIANIGLGQRYFNDAYSLGGNIFFDQDFSRSHTRMGIGGEYWRDNLKLGANGYLGLSGWKESPDMTDYDEKPANGFDLRADAYLPSYPQLGAKLTYEQYFGDHVALFGKDNLQDNPYALTAGVNYTPIPLITLGIDQKQGQSGSHETRFNLDFNYKFGQSLQQQVDPSQVQVQRSLAGSRYDLVDRNNDIVLQYRKQEVIKLTMVSSLSGQQGDNKSLEVQVSHKYPLKDIEWQGDAAIKPTSQGGQWFVKFPAYNPTGTNTYTLTAIASDTNGNASAPVSATIEILPNMPSTTNGESTLHVATGGLEALPADGHSNTILEIKLNNENGYPVTGHASDIGLDLAFVPGNTRAMWAGVINEPAAEPQLTVVTETSPGIYQATLIAGYQPGDAKITANIGNVTLQPITIPIHPLDISAADSTMVLDKNDAVANDQDVVTARLTVNDVNNKPVPNLVKKSGMLSFTAEPAEGVNVSNITEESLGIYTAQITSTKGHITDITPVVEGEKLTNLKQTINFIGSVQTSMLKDGSSVTINPNSQIADGTALETVTALVTDQFDNPVKGVPVTFTINNPGNATQFSNNGTTITVSTQDNGTAQATLSSKQAGAFDIVTTIAATAAGPAAQTVSAIFVADVSNATFATPNVEEDGAVVGDQLGNDTGTNRVRFKLIDQHGNPVPDQPISFTFSGAGGNTAAVVPASDPHGADANHKATTDANGETYIDFTNTKIGATTVTATHNSAQKSADTLFVADNASATFETLDVLNSPQAVATNNIEIQATVRDQHHNPVTDGTDVTFALAGNPAGATVTPTVKTSGGVATTQISATKAGIYQVTATVNGRTASAEVEFTANTLTATFATPQVQGNNAMVGGTEENRVLFTLVDQNDNPIAGETVNFTFSGAGAGTATVVPGNGLQANAAKQATTDINGQAYIIFTNTTSGDTNVTAHYGSKNSQPANTQFVPDDDQAMLETLVADNSPQAVNGTAITVTATVKDHLGNPVTNGTQVEFSLPAGTTGATIVQPTVDTVAGGKATTSITATQANTYTVTAKVNGRTTNTNVTFTADHSTATFNTPVVEDNDAVVGNTERNRVSFTLKDGNNNPIVGQTVSFAFSGTGSANATVVAGTGPQANAAKQATTDSNGQTYILFTNTTAGETKVTATFGSVNSQAASTMFVPDDASADFATLTSNNGGTQTVGSSLTLTATVKDQYGHNVSDSTPVTFSEPANTTVGTKNTVTTNGQATTTITSNKTGSYTVTATVGSRTKPITVTFTANAATTVLNSGSLAITQNNQVANDTAANTVQAKVVDGNGNNVPNTSVTFSLPDNNPGVRLASTSANTDANGVATMNVYSTKAVTNVKVKASVRSNASSQEVNTLNFIADTSTIKVDSVSFGKTSVISNNSDSTTVTAHVSDANNNPISNRDVTFTLNSGTGAVFSNVTATDSSGDAKAVIKSSTAGVVTVRATTKKADNSDVFKISSNLTFVAPVDTSGAKITPVRNARDFSPTTLFPTTGFAGVQFKVIPTGNTADNANFDWQSSNENAAPVDGSGVVTLNAKPAGEVTITARQAGNTIYTYKFTIRLWFSTPNGEKYTAWPAANSFCNNSLPTVKEITGSDAGGTNNNVGSLLGEWGDVITAYNWPGVNYWSSQTSTGNKHYYVYLPGSLRADVADDNSGYTGDNALRAVCVTR